MRTCASCGKANNPIRKYCVRCGKLLIKEKVEKPTPTPTSVITETQIPDLQPTASPPADQYIPSDSVKPTTDDEWVRPSQVSRDRVRSGSSSTGKSEMEKAREAFARAEGVGIDEADGSGIVETRMLRASEVRELMGEGATIMGDTSTPTQPTPSAAPTPPSTAPTPPAAQSPTKPETTPASPPAPTSSIPEASPPVTPTPSPPVQTAPPQSTQPPVVAPAAKPETQVNKPAPEPTPKPPPPTPAATTLSTPVKPPASTPVATSSSSISLDTRIPEVEEILSQITESEDLQDTKIKDLVASLTTQHAELRTVNDDLDNVSARLDEFVRSCLNDAEVKRIHYESLCEQERFAKQEYESAKKEYERVDKRRKKEISNLESKVKNVEKNIAKSKDALEKRIAELDKVREKIAELQSDGQ